MAFDLHYETIIAGFNSKRNEILETLTHATPCLADVHKREWRIQQLQNAISDVKNTIAACNIQIEEERAILDELSSENTRLSSQARKLTEDVKLLEGITGMEAMMPSDGDAEILNEIENYSERFRENAAEFYLSIPKISQEVCPDSTIGKESALMVSTVRDYIELQYNTRAADANISKDLDNCAQYAESLKRKIEDETAAFNRKYKNAKKEAEEEFDEKTKEFNERLSQLKQDYRSMKLAMTSVKKEMTEAIEAARKEEERLRLRCNRLYSFHDAFKENLRRRAMEIEFDLDRFENRIRAIRQCPSVADKKLINIALITGKKSELIARAVAQMRQEISEFNMSLR